VDNCRGSSSQERTLNRQPAERYLYAILELEEAGVAPIRARLCDRFNASHAAVETNVRRLARSGYLRAESDRVLELSSAGQTLARTLLRNLRVAERFLAALGIDDATIRVDAEKWALVMSDDVAEALSNLLNGSAPFPFDHPTSLG
jgi:DtxR family transcriptional regulator, Mn-dependent transcriptional regulator